MKFICSFVHCLVPYQQYSTLVTLSVAASMPDHDTVIAVFFEHIKMGGKWHHNVKSFIIQVYQSLTFQQLHLALKAIASKSSQVTAEILQSYINYNDMFCVAGVVRQLI